MSATRDSSGRFARPTGVRFTAYGRGGVPLAHADTKRDAVQLGRERGEVMAVVKRLRAYPFTHLHEWTGP